MFQKQYITTNTGYQNKEYQKEGKLNIKTNSPAASVVIDRKL